MNTSPLKICHAFLFFSIRFAGGTCDLMYKIAKAQANAGHKPIIYTGDYKLDSELVASIPEADVRVEKSHLDKAGFSIMPGLPARCRAELPSIDVVHMHVFRTYQNAVLYHFCRKFNVPYVMDAHGAVPYYRRKRGLKKLFDKWWGRRILQDAAFLLAETQVGVQEYLDIDPTLDPSRIVVLSPPFDTDQFANPPARGAFRTSLGIGADDPVIMFLGRVHHIKGNDFLIKGFAEMMKTRQTGKLVIVGSDDGHMVECKALAKELGVEDKVIFAGFLSGDRKLSALVDADVVAQMSRQEQGAWAPIEAVLVGTPIIVTAHTGSGEDIRRLDAGETVDFDDVPQLARKLEGLLNDREAAKARTMKAKAFIEANLSFKTRVGEYIDLYRKALERHGRA